MKKGWKPLAYLLASILTVGTLPVSVPAAEAETIFNETEADNLNQAEDILFEPEAEGNTEEEIPASVTYMVTLDANGGVFYDQWDDSLGGSLERAEVLTKIVPVGESVEVFPPVQESVGEGQSAFVFAGWSFSREGEAEIPEGEAFVPDTDCSLYAVWQTAEAAEVEPAGAFENSDSEVPEMDQILSDSDMAEQTAEESEAVEAGEEAEESDEVEAPEETEGLGAVEASAETEGLETVETSAETGAFEVEEAPAGTGEFEVEKAPAETEGLGAVEAPAETGESEVEEVPAEMGESVETGAAAEVWESDVVEEAGEESASEETKSGVTDQGTDQGTDEDPEDAPEAGQGAESTDDETVVSEEPDTPEVTSISLDPKEIVADINSGGFLNYSCVPDEADPPEVEWSSSNEEVVTVEDGMLTYWSAGEAVITVSVQGHPEINDTCKVTVIALVNEIALSQTAITVNKGKTAALKIREYWPDEPTNKSVTWKSSDTTVATVDAEGTVKGVAKGTATITATAEDGGGAQASCKVTVTVPVTKITLAKTSLILNKGAKTALKVKSVVPSDANNKAVTWKSSNTKIATVDAQGNVKAVAKGTATITATAKDGSGVKASCKVTVKVPVTKITLAKTSLILNKGVKTALKVKSVLPSNANNKAVTWKSSNTKIATVDAKGNVKAIAKGTATITATAKDGSGKKATCKVTVRVPVSRIKLNKTSASVKGGTKVTLKATVYPSNANNKAIKWSSSNPAVASVSSKGVVKGLSIGTVTITGTAKDGSKKKVTAKFKVTSNAAVIASGKWNPQEGPGGGTWKIVPNKTDVPVKKCGCTLIFAGKGEMESSCEDGDNAYPWSRYRSIITDLRVGKGITGIALGAFSGFTKLKNAELPQGLKSISDAAFGRCTALKEISVPDSVTFMGFPFVDCTALTAFKIPAGVKNIDEYCFSGCKNLKSVRIHAGVKNIYDYAFEDCTSLKDVYYAGTAKQWNSIHIQEGNNLLKKAKIHYNSK